MKPSTNTHSKVKKPAKGQPNRVDIERLKVLIGEMDHWLRLRDETTSGGISPDELLWPTAEQLSELTSLVTKLYRTLKNKKSSKPLWQMIVRVANQWDSLGGLVPALDGLLKRFDENTTIGPRTRLFQDYAKMRLGTNWASLDFHAKDHATFWEPMKKQLKDGSDAWLIGFLLASIENTNLLSLETGHHLLGPVIDKYLSKANRHLVKQFWLKTKNGLETNRFRFQNLLNECSAWDALHLDNWRPLIWFFHELQNMKFRTVLNRKTFITHAIPTPLFAAESHVNNLARKRVSKHRNKS